MIVTIITEYARHCLQLSVATSANHDQTMVRLLMLSEVNISNHLIEYKLDLLCCGKKVHVGYG